MRIVIDLQGAQTESRFRGIGRYSLSLAQAIVRNRGEHEVLIALNGLFPDTIEPIRSAFDGLLPQKNICVWYAPGPVRECETGNIWYREAAERIREAFLASLQPDVLHLTSLFEGYEDDAVTSIDIFNQRTPTVITLYDLIPFQNPDQYLRPNPSYEQFYLRKIEHLKRACAWLAISNYSAKEGCKVLGLRADKMFNISTACDPCFECIEISPQAEAELRRRYGITRPFMLYAGGADSRKNLHRLIRAYALLSPALRKTHQLVLAGKMPESETFALQATAKSAGLSKDEMIFTGYVTNDELVQLYNLCKLFVFPSWQEGFGLPILEAMSCGAPVVAADTSSVPEIVERKDAMFDPFSEEAIAAKIIEVLTDDALRDELICYGVEQAKKFCWDGTAKLAIAAFEHIHAERKKTHEEIQLPVLRPKLAYFSPLPPERSGISDYSSELLPELARYYDIDVIVAQPETSDQWIKACLPIRSVEWFMQHANRYDRLLYHIGNSIFHRHMFDLLDRFPGVVVLHDFFLSSIIEHLDAKGYVPGAWALELYKSHGYAAVWERFHKQDMNEVVFKYPCNFSVLQQAIGVIVHSAYSAGLASEIYGNGLADDWAIIPLLRVPTCGADRIASRDKLGLEPNDFIVCSFGMLDPLKQNHRLLSAWLRSDLINDPSCRLIFVGENHCGEYGQRLLDTIRQSGLSDRICSTDWVDIDTFRHYLAAADMAVQLRAHSRGETSAAILDCMNYGLPTIVNANGSIAELPKDALWILPDEFEDSELIEALNTLWHDDERRLTLGARAREVILTRHAPQACAEQYVLAIENFYAYAETGRHALIETLAGLENSQDDERAIVALATAIAQNLPMKRMARTIFLDVSETCCNDLRTGIQRVTRALMWELIQSPPEGFRIEPVFNTNEGGYWHYRYARHWTLSSLNCPDDWLADELVEFQPGDVMLVTDLTGDRVEKAEQAGAYQRLRDIEVALYFMVYDLLPIQMPEAFPPDASDVHERWLKAVCCIADGVICDSKTIADELTEWLETNGPNRMRPLKIGWFHLGADVNNSMPTSGLLNDAQQVLAQLAVRPSFLMVGTIEPRKGYLQTIAAFNQLWDLGVDVNLVIVGKVGWKGVIDEMRRTIPTIVEMLIHHPKKGVRLFWLEGISDEYLEKIYAASTCLIAASDGEGFGLPLIEAAQHKLPIISRDISVFHEVAGEHAFYFKGKEPADLARAVQEWLALYRSDLHQKTDDLLWQTWKQSTQQLLGVILWNKWHTEWRNIKTGTCSRKLPICQNGII